MKKRGAALVGESVEFALRCATKDDPTAHERLRAEATDGDPTLFEEEYAF